MRLRNKDLSNLVRVASKQGWVITYTNGGHLRWVSPAGRTVFSSSTPSDRRSIKNIRKELRLRGFIELRTKKH